MDEASPYCFSPFHSMIRAANFFFDLFLPLSFFLSSASVTARSDALAVSFAVSTMFRFELVFTPPSFPPAYRFFFIFFFFFFFPPMV